jgi:formate dehydrogenase
MSHDAQKVRSFEHPGEGRKRAKSTPKGRQVDPQAAEEIAVLLGDRPRRRDLLIEHLHLIQDKHHQISAAHLAALADEMKLSFAEVFETATFYAHFDVVKEGEANIPPLTIRVCDSLTCAMLGGEKLLHELQTTAGPGIRVVRAPCVGRCDTAPAVEVGHHFVDRASVASVLAAAKGGDTHAHLPDYIGYDAYVSGGGYTLLKRLRSGELSKEDLLKALDDASLRGLGGDGAAHEERGGHDGQEPRVHRQKVKAACTAAAVKADPPATRARLASTLSATRLQGSTRRPRVCLSTSCSVAA